MNELIERLNEMSRVMTHSDGVVTTTVARLLTYQESYEATGLCREAADTLLALQTQLERVERENEVMSTALHKIVDYLGVNEMSVAPVLPVAPYRMKTIAREALPQTEQQKG